MTMSELVHFNLWRVTENLQKCITKNIFCQHRLLCSFAFDTRED